uniref:Uncharacterized protein n=1 Tax=Capra hircus TaxID=9925 RepID=A0A8C2SK14_CAPHI
PQPLSLPSGCPGRHTGVPTGPGLPTPSRVVGLPLRSSLCPLACVGPAETHPRPPKPDPVKSVSGVLSGLTPAKSAPVINNGSPTILGKRSYEQHNGVDGNVKKRLLMPSRGTYLGLANHGQTRHMGPSRNLLLNGKAYPTKVRLIRGGSLPPVKRRRMNWIDAPDDVFYMATEETRWGGRAGGARGARGSVLRC